MFYPLDLLLIFEDKVFFVNFKSFEIRNIVNAFSLYENRVIFFVFKLFGGFLKLDSDDGHEQVDQKKGDYDHAGDKKQLRIQIKSLAYSVHYIGPAFVSGHLKNIDKAVAEGVERDLIPENIGNLFATNAVCGAIGIVDAIIPLIILMHINHVKP